MSSTNAQLSFLYGLRTDSIGNLYFADYFIRKINKATNIATIAGIVRYGYNGDNIQATNALLYNPYDVFVDSIGRFLYCRYL